MLSRSTRTRKGSSKHLRAAEEYQSRLERAVNAELVFQAAAAEGVELTAQQSRLLDDLRAGYAKKIAAYKAQGLQWTSITEAQVDFSVRQTHALLLQQDLVAQGGGPSPEESADYALAVDELLARLQASAEIVAQETDHAAGAPSF